MHGLIVVTGTPGTGKTTASAILGRRLGIPVLHLREFVKERGISSGYDRAMDSELVDLRKLGRELKKAAAGEDLIVEGHLACDISLPARTVFVLRCSPKELEGRLRKRRYAGAKMEENLMAEMLDYCAQRAERNYPHAKIYELETAGNAPKQTAVRMGRLIKNGGRGDRIAYGKELKGFLKLK